MSGEDQNADPLEAAHSTKSRILQKQLEFEQLLMNNQLWAEQQAVKLEVGIKSVALQAAVDATEVRKCLPGQRNENDSVVKVVNELSSRRPFTGVQKQHPLSLDRASSEKDIRAEKDYPHRGRESRASSHRRHGCPRSSRGRSRSRSRDRERGRHRSRSRSETRDRHSRSRRDTGYSHSYRYRYRSRSISRSRSTRGIRSGRDRSRSRNRGYSSQSPPKNEPQK